MPGFLIRPLLREDVPAVTAIDRVCSPVPWSQYAFAAEITNTVGLYRVAEVDGRVVGFIGAHVVLDEAHITNFGVEPEYRRRYIGERLLASLLEEALHAGARRVTLEVRERNHPAQALYQKYGFQPLGRRRAYYTDNNEDAVIMGVEDTSRYAFRTLFEERVAALAGVEDDAG